MTNLEMFQLVSQLWCDNQNLMKLAGCKKSKMAEIKKDIRIAITKKGHKLPPDIRILPMGEVIEFLGIDVDRIIKNAQVEAQIEKATAVTVTK